MEDEATTRRNLYRYRRMMTAGHDVTSTEIARILFAIAEADLAQISDNGQFLSSPAGARSGSTH
jgi:hypothetical protein